MNLTISIDHPCLFITAVAKGRLPVFRTDEIKAITCTALDEARASCGFLLFSYVLMEDHVHLFTDRPRQPSTVLRFVMVIISRRPPSSIHENYSTPPPKHPHPAACQRNAPPPLTP